MSKSNDLIENLCDADRFADISSNPWGRANYRELFFIGTRDDGTTFIWY